MALKFSSYEGYIDKFNAGDEETVVQHISNAAAKDWLSDNIPLFECPDKELEEAYYFRWWVYRKHVKKTPDGFVITEFHPDVPWAGKHNTIVCPAGHHIYEGRWLRDGKYIEDYIRFWYRKGGALRAYSNWLGDAVWQYCTARGDFRLAVELLDDMVADYREWERTNRHESGLFWSNDDRDGQEYSISGSGLRPTLNSYMIAYAETITRTALAAGRGAVADEFTGKAEQLKRLLNDRLWDDSAQFYKVIPLAGKDLSVTDWSFAGVDPAHNVREQLGFAPWYFNAAPAGHEKAWVQLLQKDGFSAPYGPTTAEQRHPRFQFTAEHECLWNGPSWPFATSMTLAAMANLLNGYQQDIVTKSDYLSLLRQYADSHWRMKPDGTRARWLDENLDPFTGDWISRTQLEKWGWRQDKGGRERGKDYNHSSFCDLVVNGLIGLRPQTDSSIVVNTLVPQDEWDYFCLDHVPYRGKYITILHDKYGDRYGKGSGLHIFSNDHEIRYNSILSAID